MLIKSTQPGAGVIGKGKYGGGGEDEHNQLKAKMHVNTVQPGAGDIGKGKHEGRGRKERQEHHIYVAKILANIEAGSKEEEAAQQVAAKQMPAQQVSAQQVPAQHEEDGKHLPRCYSP